MTTATQLQSETANPFREGKFGFVPWSKGWRPQATATCQKCGATVNTSGVVTRDFHCKDRRSGKPCGATVNPLWEHSNWNVPLSLWDIWERIVFVRWGMKIGINTTEVKRLAALPVRVVQRSKKTAFVYDAEDSHGEMEDELGF